MSTLLAVCAGTGVGEQIFGVVIATLVFVAWAGLSWRAVGFERAPEERIRLGAVFVAAAIVGAIVIASLHGEIVATLFIALLAVAAIGVGGAFLSSRVEIVSGIGAAIAGGSILPVGVILVLILHVSLGSGCLGEELG